jgi:hypothetical protein
MWQTKFSNYWICRFDLFWRSFQSTDKLRPVITPVKRQQLAKAQCPCWHIFKVTTCVGCYVVLGARYGLSSHYCLTNLKRECMCFTLGTAPHKEATVQTWNSPDGQTGGRPSSLHAWEPPTRLRLCCCVSTVFSADLQHSLVSALASVCPSVCLVTCFTFLLSHILSFFLLFVPSFLFCPTYFFFFLFNSYFLLVFFLSLLPLFFCFFKF